MKWRNDTTNEKRVLDLQLFAGEGAGEGGAGDGAPTSGENATVDAEQRLRELGVPEDKIRRRAKSASANKTAPAQRRNCAPAEKVEAQDVQVAAANDPTEEPKTNASSRMSWEEIMADPEYNKQMQSIVQSRLRSAKGAEETLSKLTPVLEVLARKHGLDVNNIDYDALIKAVTDDDSYYEDKALEMGVPVETAKKIDQQEREDARKKNEEERTLQQQKFRQHILSLEQQGQLLKKTFPSFDLRKELQNPVFARMTSPNVGISVQDAYYAVHRKEIQEASTQVTAQQTAKKISNAIQAGSRRPTENGTSGQAASVTIFDYRNASKEQREALKKRIFEAKANGEKLYPGQ